MANLSSSDPTPVADTPAPRPSGSWGALLGRAHGLTALALTGAVAMHAINVHIVTTVLPSVVQEIGGLPWYAWSTTLFVVGSIIGAALSVKLLASSTARTAMLGALLVFALGTLLCATAANMPVMLLGRTVQGLGGGTVGALSYTLIRMVFPPHLWPRAIALVSGMWGIATLSGPAVGGLFAQSGHWRWAFWSLLPLLAAQMLLVHRRLSPDRMLLPTNAPSAGIPARQIALLALSVLLIATASVLSGTALQALCVAAGLLTGAWALASERSATARLLPRGGTSVQHPLGMLYAVVALLLMGTMTEIFVPYFLQHLHGLQPLTAGYVTALLAGGWSLASVMFSGQSGRAVRQLMLTGPLLCTVGLAALAVAMPLQGSWALTICALALTAIGLGVGMAWPHVLNAIMHSASKDEADVAASAITTVQLYGMAVGAALVGLVANALGVATQTDVAALGHSALWLFGLFALFPAVGTFYMRRFLASAAV
jgi:MFS family permease